MPADVFQRSIFSYLSSASPSLMDAPKSYGLLKHQIVRAHGLCLKSQEEPMSLTATEVIF